LTKKRNKETETVEGRLKKIASDVVAEGVKHVLSFSLRDDGHINMGTSFESFDEIHSLLNRVLFNVTMTHEESIKKMNETKKESSSE